MTRSDQVIRWQSMHDAARSGLEVREAFDDPVAMEAEVRRIVGDMTPVPAFVLARARDLRADTFRMPLRRSAKGSAALHLCIAVNCETLSSIESQTPGLRAFGLVLDGVSAHTPLSAVGSELLEAIRFDDGFVREATANVRQRCLLDALLGLAHDLGLATLGPLAQADLGPAFDYTASDSARVAGLPRTKRRHIG